MSITDTPTTTESILRSIAQLQSIRAPTTNTEDHSMTVTQEHVSIAAQAVHEKELAFVAAKAAYIAAETAVTQAEHAAENAKHFQKAEDLVQAVDDASLALRRAATAAKVAAAQVADAKKNYAFTMHVALQPDHDAAKAARLAACQKADAARAMLAEAASEFESARLAIEAVYAAGRRRTVNGNQLTMRAQQHHQEQSFHVPTEADELGLFAGQP
jgi:hypothetical protein